MNNFSEFSSFKNKIDLIYGNFEKIKLQNFHKNSLIFINFEELFKLEEITLFPKKFHDIMKKALSLTQNIVILFPAKLQLSNLAPFFNQNLEIYKHS